MSISSSLAAFKFRSEQDPLLYAAQTLAVFLPVFLVAGRAVADWGLSLTAVLFLVERARRRDWIWLKEPWVRLALLLWVWLIVTSLVSGAGLSSLVRSAGWIRFPVFVSAMIFWFADRAWFERFVIVAGAAVGFTALDTLFQAAVGYDVFGFPPLGDRLTGPFRKDPQTGIYITKMSYLFALPFLAAVSASGRKKGLFAAFGAMLVLFLTIVLSGERMASILFLLGLGLTFLVMPRLRRFSLLLGLVCVLSVGALMTARPAVMNRHVQQTAGVASHFAKSPYGHGWLNGLRVGAEHPLFGVGPKNFRTHCTCKEFAECKEGDVLCLLHPHNLYIEWFAETGVPGFVGFLVLIGLWLARMGAALKLPSPSGYALGAWVAVCLQLWPLSATGSFFSNWNECLFWLALGAALAASPAVVRRHDL